MNAARLSILSAVVAFAALPVLAVDWPQWRGPDRTGVSKEAGLLKAWPKEGPKLLWTNRDGGNAYSGPVVIGDTLYTLGSDNKSEFVFAVDVKTGKKLWSTDFGPKFASGGSRGDGPRSTPTVDGDHIYALGGTGELACLELGTGKLIWHKNLVGDLGGQIPNQNWGFSESPLVDGDVVVCAPGGRKGTLAALNKKTGEVVWRSEGVTDGCSFSSAIAVETGGVKQYVTQTAKGMIGVAAKDGKLLWKFDNSAYKTAVVPTPIYRDSHVFGAAGYGAGCQLVKLDGKDGSFTAEKVYQNKNMVNHHGGVVLVGDHLYGYSDGAGWVIMDFKSGEVKASDKGLDKGSVTCADGMLYRYGEGSGSVVLSPASPDGWKEGGKISLPEKSAIRHRDGKFWTHPVVSNGKLYIRDQDLLFCFDVKAK